LPTALTKPKPTYSYDDYAQELRESLHATNQLAKEHLKQEKFKANSMTKVSTKKHLRLETRSYFMTKPSEEDGQKN